MLRNLISILLATETKPGIFRDILDQAGDKLFDLVFFYGMQIVHDRDKITGNIFNAADQCPRKHGDEIVLFKKGQIFRCGEVKFRESLLYSLAERIYEGKKIVFPVQRKPDDLSGAVCNLRQKGRLSVTRAGMYIHSTTNI